jgi:hypothetical protein
VASELSLFTVLLLYVRCVAEGVVASAVCTDIRVFRTCGMIDGDIGVWVYEFERG